MRRGNRARGPRFWQMPQNLLLLILCSFQQSIFREPLILFLYFLMADFIISRGTHAQRSSSKSSGSFRLLFNLMIGVWSFSAIFLSQNRSIYPQAPQNIGLSSGSALLNFSHKIDHKHQTLIMFSDFFVTKINLPDQNIGLSSCLIIFFVTKSMYLIKDRTVLLRNIFHCLSFDRPFKCCQAKKQGKSLSEIKITTF